MAGARTMLVLLGFAACTPQHPRLIVAPTVDAATDAVIEEPVSEDAGFDSDVVPPVDQPTATDLGFDAGMDVGGADSGRTDAGVVDVGAADVPAFVDVGAADAPPSGECGTDRQRCCMGAMPCRAGLTCVTVGMAFCTPCGGAFQVCCAGACDSGPCRGGFCTGI